MESVAVAAEIADQKDNHSVQDAKEEFDFSQPSEMLREHLGILRDVAAVEIRDAEVEQYIK